MSDESRHLASFLSQLYPGLSADEVIQKVQEMNLPRELQRIATRPSRLVRFVDLKDIERLVQTFQDQIVALPLGPSVIRTRLQMLDVFLAFVIESVQRDDTFDPLAYLSERMDIIDAILEDKETTDAGINNDAQ